MLPSCRGGSAGPGWPQPSLYSWSVVWLWKTHPWLLEADSGVVWSFTTKPHAPDWAVWMESEPVWRYSIRVCGCTTDTSGAKQQSSHFCPRSRWVPTHPQCWLWHSLPGQRWRAMNEVITTQQFLELPLGPSPWAQPPWPVNHTLHPGGCVDPLQKAQPSKGDSRRSVCGDNQEGVNKVWMGEASRVSLHQREGGHDKSKGESLSGNWQNCDTSQEEARG